MGNISKTPFSQTHSSQIEIVLQLIDGVGQLKAEKFIREYAKSFKILIMKIIY